VYLFYAETVYKSGKEKKPMLLDERTMRLIAVGASITANCQPCLQANIAKARENGSGEQEIAEAIWVGKMVRRGAASKMDNFADRLSQAAPQTVNPSNEGCECK
jgi:AhpD family alkylhydroperoxidase